MPESEISTSDNVLSAAFASSVINLSRDSNIPNDVKSITVSRCALAMAVAKIVKSGKYCLREQIYGGR